MRGVAQLNAGQTTQLILQTHLNVTDLWYYCYYYYYYNARGLAFYWNSPKSFQFLHAKWRKLLLEMHRNCMNIKLFFVCQNPDQD
jgi:hypothetical protein